MPGTPKTVHKITPVSFYMIDLTDAHHTDARFLVAVDHELIDLPDNDARQRHAIRIVDHIFLSRGVQPKWKNTDGAANWLAQQVRDLIKKEQPDSPEKVNKRVKKAKKLVAENIDEVAAV